MPQMTSPFRRTQPAVPDEVTELRKALLLCNQQIHDAYRCFNSTCQGELIESYVFEINALHARYSYLLRRLKELEGNL